MFKLNFFRNNQTCEKCYDKTKIAAVDKDAFNCLNDLHFLIPKIDKLLIPRLVDSLSCLERYSLAFSSQQALDLLKPKALIVAKDMIIDGENRFIPRFENFNVMVTQKLEVKYINLGIRFVYEKLFNSISSKQLIVNAKFITLYDIQITAEPFYQILSSHLLELICFNVKFSSLLSPIDFVEKLPNIKKFVFKNSHSDNSNYFDFVNCKDMKKFCVPLYCSNLTFESFKNIVKKLSKIQLQILLILNGIDEEPRNFYIETNIKNLYKLLTKD